MSTQVVAAQDPPVRRGSWLQTMRAVGWAFLGVRRDSDLEHDVRQLNPLHVVAVAIFAVALFVGGLIALVHWIA